MKTFTVSDAAKAVGVNRRTLQRWVCEKHIPQPKAEIVDGRLQKSWTATQVDKIAEYKKMSYWGKGLDRRTGKKARNRS